MPFLSSAAEDLCSTPQGRQPDVGISLDVSFDHVPKKKEPEIAHVAVVRKRDERQKLKGHSCRDCYEVGMEIFSHTGQEFLQLSLIVFYPGLLSQPRL